MLIRSDRRTIITPIVSIVSTGYVPFLISLIIVPILLMVTASVRSILFRVGTEVFDRGKSEAQVALKSVVANVQALLISERVTAQARDLDEIRALAADRNPRLSSSHNGLARAHNVLFERFSPNGMGNDQEVAAFGDDPVDEASIGHLLKAWIIYMYRLNISSPSLRGNRRNCSSSVEKTQRMDEADGSALTLASRGGEQVSPSMCSSRGNSWSLPSTTASSRASRHPTSP
jgi:hypothetical protein